MLGFEDLGISESCEAAEATLSYLKGITERGEVRADHDLNSERRKEQSAVLHLVTQALVGGVVVAERCKHCAGVEMRRNGLVERKRKEMAVWVPRAQVPYDAPSCVDETALSDDDRTALRRGALGGGFPVLLGNLK